MAIEDDSDRDFMLRLYEDYQRLIYSTIHEFVENLQDIEDIQQDLLVKLIDHLPTLRALEPKAMSSYIYTSARNSAYSFLRLRKKEAVASFDDEQWFEGSTIASGEEVETAFLRQEDMRALHDVWEQLPEQCRLLLEAKYFLGKSDAEIADTLGIKASSVRMYLTRARKTAFARMKDLYTI